MELVIKAVIPPKYLDSNTVYHINPCGLFVYGGPMVSNAQFDALWKDEVMIRFRAMLV